MSLLKQRRKIKLLIIFLLVFLIFILWFSRGTVYPPEELKYGITFSAQHAQGLGLNWQEAYVNILDELGIKRLRLSAYWNEIEASPDNYTWERLDWQVEEASQRGVEIILALGGRLPRWPECHFPDWGKELSKADREAEILDYIKKTTERYQGNKSIVAWQVENEPFLSHFGDCPELDSTFLDKEIALVRSLDNRPIVLTDSGELSFWIRSARRADIFGTTMYLETYSQNLKRYINYPIKPGFFRFKKNIISWFAHPQKWIVIELQAEPWAHTPYCNLSPTERDKLMNKDKLNEILEFARLSGFQEFYLWGAEWWYWEKEQGRGEIWEEAKKIFR